MRVCSDCNESKPPMDFYQTGSGYITRRCKPCTCARVRANRLVHLDQYTTYERQRATLPHRVEARDAYGRTDAGRQNGNRAKRDYERRNPIKRKAKEAVNNAVRDRRLSRNPCEVCGESKAQAHHDDYSKPLDVRWLCATHHTEWHQHNTPLCPDQSQAA